MSPPSVKGIALGGTYFNNATTAETCGNASLGRAC